MYLILLDEQGKESNFIDASAFIGIADSKKRAKKLVKEWLKRQAYLDGIAASELAGRLLGLYRDSKLSGYIGILLVKLRPNKLPSRNKLRISYIGYNENKQKPVICKV